MGQLLAYSVDLAQQAAQENAAAEAGNLPAEDREQLLSRSDEVGQLARLYQYLSEFTNGGARRAPPVAQG